MTIVPLLVESVIGHPIRKCVTIVPLLAQLVIGYGINDASSKFGIFQFQPKMA